MSTYYIINTDLECAVFDQCGGFQEWNESKGTGFRTAAGAMRVADYAGMPSCDRWQVMELIQVQTIKSGETVTERGFPGLTEALQTYANHIDRYVVAHSYGGGHFTRAFVHLMDAENYLEECVPLASDSLVGYRFIVYPGE